MKIIDPDIKGHSLELPQVFQKYHDMIEKSMRMVIDTRTMPLYRMMAYHMGWIDPQGNPVVQNDHARTLATICLAANSASNGDANKALPAAVATELAHNFYIIHNDLQDGNPQRNGKDALWWVWGPAQAINAGDGMHALARQSLFQMKEHGFQDDVLFKAISLFDEASLKLCEGQFLDINYQEKASVSVKSYMRMVEDKTGAMISCALKLGALTASANSKTIDVIGQAGIKLGVASQIQEDLAGLWGDTSQASSQKSSVLNKKKTLPMVYGMEKASVHEKRLLGEVYLKRVLEPPDIEKITSVIETLDVRQDCIKMSEQFCNEALSLIESIGLKSNDLNQVAHYLAFGN